VDEERQVRVYTPLQLTGRQLLWAGVAVVLLTIAILIGYRYGITLWDWIKLLVIPAVIAGGGLWFNAQQREREQRIADERAQDEALQAYLDQISQLLTDKERPLHRAQQGDSLSTVARARTLTVLSRLDGHRKASVVQFLNESGLIRKDRLVLALDGADLGGADLREARLHMASLLEADLEKADLRGADLRKVIGITNEELAQQTKNLEGTIMPNGQKAEEWLKIKGQYEEWLKIKGHHEQWLKNRGLEEDKEQELGPPHPPHPPPGRS